MKYLLGLTIEELKEWCTAQKEPAFRAKQIFEWLHQKGVSEYSKMTNLSSSLREKLEADMRVSPLKLARMQDSDDAQTRKFLWELEDEKLVESVLIEAPDRFTVCVSSQVGCPARCAFCASGREGLVRNLTAGEIFAQVYHIQNYLLARGQKVTNVVYMGMGEPFRNYDEVVKSIRMLINPDMLNMSQRRITVSTVGVVEGITQFAQENLKVNLVLSLHAPNQHLRQKIIPYARHYSLDTILEAMDLYADKTGRDITYEYTLIHGINDGEEQAKELVQLLRKKQCTVNLIPYNPVAGLKLKRPDKDAVELFREILTDAGIVNTCRYTKGDDIAAACGQLAMQQKSTLFNVI